MGVIGSEVLSIALHLPYNAADNVTYSLSALSYPVLNDTVTVLYYRNFFILQCRSHH